MTTQLERVLAAVQHQEQDGVPVVLWDNAPPVTRLYGVRERDYHHNAEIKLQTQLRAITDFPDAMWVPGIYADFGTAVAGSILGCEVIWFDDDAPHAAPTLQSVADIDHVKPKNIRREGLTAVALGQLRYFWQHVDPKLIEEYGYLDGLGISIGPIEAAAQLRGYGDFLTDLYDHPKEIHKLLAIATETVIEWLHAQEEVNGRLKRLILPEHFPGNLSLAHFEEFCFPYLKQIFDAFGYAPIRMYHNEGQTNHMFHRVSDFGANVFHCGQVDLRRAKEVIGSRVCLMGNVSATTVLLSGTPDEVTEACNDCLSVAAPGSGYLLTCGGAFAPGTPRENLMAMVEAGKAWRPSTS